MHDSDNLFFSNFVVPPEFGSICECDDLYDFDFDESPEHIKDETDFDDLNEYNWDDV